MKTINIKLIHLEANQYYGVAQLLDGGLVDKSLSTEMGPKKAVQAKLNELSNQLIKLL